MLDFMYFNSNILFIIFLCLYFCFKYIPRTFYNYSHFSFVSLISKKEKSDQVAKIRSWLVQIVQQGSWSFGLRSNPDGVS